MKYNLGVERSKLPAHMTVLGEYKEHYARQNKADIKDNILYDFVSVKF